MSYINLKQCSLRFLKTWLELRWMAKQGSDAGLVRNTQPTDGSVVIGGVGLGAVTTCVWILYNFS